MDHKKKKDWSYEILTTFDCQWLTSLSLREVVWTVPAADSAAPESVSVLGWRAPALEPTHHLSVSASHSPLGSHVARYEVPGTDTPTGNRLAIKINT